MQKVFMHISEAMRTRILLLFLLFTTTANAQDERTMYSVEDYVGTWQYVSNDTIFTVKFVEGKTINSPFNLTFKELFGGYALKVGGVIIDDYLNISSVRDMKIKNPSEQQIYMIALAPDFNTRIFGMMIYDQRKKHFEGQGISGCHIAMVAKNKLKWTLNEERGISIRLEGCEDCPEIKPIGFSVPTNVILTKVE